MDNFQTQYKGLSEQDVAEKLLKEGYNELPDSNPRNIFRIIVDVIKEPMFILLVICAILYIILGDKEEGFMLLGFVFIIIIIEFIQEHCVFMIVCVCMCL